LPTPSTLWFHEPDYQFMSTYHWQPLVNGYSGHASVEYLRMLEALRELSPDASLEVFKERGVEMLLLNERFFAHGEFDAFLLRCQDQRWFSEVRVFDDSRLQRIAACRLRSRPG
jgi:hypothetical protein